MEITKGRIIFRCREDFLVEEMIITNTPGVLSKFGRTTWGFQATFNTPLKTLDSFVSTILPDEGEFEKGSVTIDEIVFEPKTLMPCLLATSLRVN